MYMPVDLAQSNDQTHDPCRSRMNGPFALAPRPCRRPLILGTSSSRQTLNSAFASCSRDGSPRSVKNLLAPPPHLGTRYHLDAARVGVGTGETLHRRARPQNVPRPTTRRGSSATSSGGREALPPERRWRCVVPLRPRAPLLVTFLVRVPREGEKLTSQKSRLPDWAVPVYLDGSSMNWMPVGVIPERSSSKRATNAS